VLLTLSTLLSKPLRAYLDSFLSTSYFTTKVKNKNPG
jgi:hypothetical protein